MEVPSGALAIGVPVQVYPGRSNLEMIRMAASEYVANGRRYRSSLVQVG
jgi:hypothetical protein